MRETVLSSRNVHHRWPTWSFIFIFLLWLSPEFGQASLTYGSLISSIAQWPGVPYRWGGNDADGIDCSHFVYRAYTDAGYDSPYPPTYHQIEIFKEKGRCLKNFGDTIFTMDSLRFGDLVYCRWTTDYGATFYHVWLFLDGDYFMHADYPEGINISKINYFDEYLADLFIARPAALEQLTAHDRAAVVDLRKRVDRFRQTRAYVTTNVIPLAIEGRKRKLVISDLHNMDAWCLFALYHSFDAFHNLPMSQMWLQDYFTANLENYVPSSRSDEVNFTKIEERNRLFVKVYMCKEGFIPPPVVPEKEVKQMQNRITKLDSEIEEVVYIVNPKSNLPVIDLVIEGQRSLLTADDICDLSAIDLCLLRNAFYAMHNRPFKTQWIQEYFEKNLHGYNPDKSNLDIELNEIELRNVYFIKSYEGK